MKDLDTLKNIFLADDVDSETYDENLAEITRWEEAIHANENLLSWQEHDITKTLMQDVRKFYVDISLQLLDRKITDERRKSIWARQDACLWILSLGSAKPKEDLKHINADIKKALAQV